MNDQTMPEAADTRATWFIDSDSSEVAGFVQRALTAGAVDLDDQRGVAVALFLAVRDGIRYNPYDISVDPAVFRASTIAISESNWCVPKAVLYTAALRHAGIPARLAFADVLNHLTSEKLTEAMGTDLFAWHGFTEVYLGGEWFKVSTAFNIELCERFGVKVLDFDGTSDALMHPFDEVGHRHMEYVLQRGSFQDLPLDEIIATYTEVYANSTTGATIGATTHPDPAFARDEAN